MRLAASTGPRVGVKLTAQTAGAASTAVTSTAVLGTGRGLSTFQPGVYLLGLEQGMWAGATSLPAIDDHAWFSLPSVVMVIEDESGD
jgi:hypothetical protein